MTAILPVVPKYPSSAMHIGDRRTRGAEAVAHDAAASDP